MFDSAEQLAAWLEGFDFDQPLADLVEIEWLEEEITLTLDELRELEKQGREYAQELQEQGIIYDIPPMDMPEQLLEQGRTHEPDMDFGR